MSVRLARKYSDVDKKLSPLDRDDVFLQRFKIFWGLAVRSSTLCCRLKIRCKKCLPLIHTRIGKHHSVHTPHIGMVRQILRILLLVTYYTILVGSFIVPLSQLPTQRSTPRKTVDRTSKYSDTKFQDIHYRYKAFITEAEEEESTDVNCWTRRWVLTCGLALVSTIPTGVGATTPSGLREVEPAEAATATEAPGEVSVNRGEADEIADEGPNFDALVDLPPVTEGCVRLFLCRHGQTENNRLRKVQGARVDISINENGIEQAKNLGQALKRILPMKPKEFFSSKLIRARMTAEIAKSMVMTQENGQEEGKITSVKQLDSLGEVDFGPIAEGRPIALAKAGMQATYAVWATGNVDYRPEGGEGESGREVRRIPWSDRLGSKGTSPSS